jgi:predicted metal-dependent hydrolase
VYVVDYVIVHEVAHLIEHNHRDDFWKIVKTQMGDCSKQEEWLGNLEI